MSNESELRRQLLEAKNMLDRWRPVVLAARDLIGKNVTRPHVYQSTDTAKYHLALALAEAGQDLPEEPMGEGAVYCIPHRVYYGRGGICRKCLKEVAP